MLQVHETFVSVQGESSFAGMPCFFIRLAGCNLACRWCDTPAARAGGRDADIAGLVAAVRTAALPLVEVTGGEPLCQPETPALLAALVAAGPWTVLLETNGALDLGAVPPAVRIIMDAKCPGSGMEGCLCEANLGRLTRQDEVKFVIKDNIDYRWAAAMVGRWSLPGRCGHIWFSPVRGALAPVELAGWILQDRLPVQLGGQLHKDLGWP